MSAIHNERTKLLELALNAAAASAFVGVLASVAATFYDLGSSQQARPRLIGSVGDGHADLAHVSGRGRASPPWRRSPPRLKTLYFGRIQPQLAPDVGVARRIEGAPVLGEVAQGGETGLGEVRRGPAPARVQLDQAALDRALDGGRQLGPAASGLPRQVRSVMPSAIVGSWPKRGCSSRRISSRSGAVNAGSPHRLLKTAR